MIEPVGSRMKRIEITFKGTSIKKIQNFLLDYFAWEKSPLCPLMIINDVITSPSNQKGYVEGELYKFRIVEVYNNDNFQHHVLAKIIFSKYPSGVMMFIEEVEVEEEINENDWSKVKDIVLKIISKAKEHVFQIASVSPKELLDSVQQDEKPPWEKIEDRGKNREILRLWWEGYTNKEIADKLGYYEPRTITNQISLLRKQYTQEIVPFDETRRKQLINGLKK